MTAHKPPAGAVGEEPSRRAFLADLGGAYAAACTTAGVLACLAALYGLAVLTRPLGLLLLALSHGGHL